MATNLLSDKTLSDVKLVIF